MFECTCLVLCRWDQRISPFQQDPEISQMLVDGSRRDEIVISRIVSLVVEHRVVTERGYESTSNYFHRIDVPAALAE